MIVIRGNVAEDSPALCRARIEAPGSSTGGTPIVQADVTAVTAHIYDLTAGGESSDAGKLTLPSTCIYDTLQGWTIDNKGFNFAHTFLSTNFGTGDHVYQISVMVDPATSTDSEYEGARFQITTERTYLRPST